MASIYWFLFHSLFFFQICVILTDPFLYNGNFLPPLLFKPLRVVFCSSSEIRMVRSCFRKLCHVSIFSHSICPTSEQKYVTFLGHKCDNAARNVLENPDDKDLTCLRSKTHISTFLKHWEVTTTYPPRLHGSCIPLENMMLLPNLFNTVSILYKRNMTPASWILNLES